MLLVLDDCEHVIAALASFADEVLSTLPAVRILAGSTTLRAIMSSV